MNVLVVDDQKTFLEAMANWLAGLLHGAVLYKALSGLEAYDMIESVKPDIILMDVNMPDLNGLETTRLILKKYPESKIVVLTTIDGEPMILSLLKAGVRGFLFKDAGEAEIKTCIETVYAGSKYYCAEVDDIVSRNVHLLENQPVVDLNKREKEIIWLMGAGNSSKEIAAQLGIKEKIVNSIREQLLKKTKTKNATQLVAYAFFNVLMDGKK